jgi:transposase
MVCGFSPSRAGEHARNFLGIWNGKLVYDDFAGYKTNSELGITEIGCMAYARRKFLDLHVANKSQLAVQALHSIGGLSEVEQHAKEMGDEHRWRLPLETVVPIAEKLQWDWVGRLRFESDGAFQRSWSDRSHQPEHGHSQIGGQAGCRERWVSEL